MMSRQYGERVQNKSQHWLGMRGKLNLYSNLSLIIITHWLCDIISTSNLYYWPLLVCLCVDKNFPYFV